MPGRRATALLLAFLALGGCGGSAPPSPAPTSMSPGSGPRDADTPVVIHGSSFAVLVSQPASGGSPTVNDTFQAWLGDLPLRDVRWVDDQTLSATVPAGLAPGVKSLRVQGPYGTSGQLAAAYTVEGPVVAPLSAAIAAVPERLSVGQTVTVTLVVTNTGDADVTNVVPVTPTVTGVATATVTVVATATGITNVTIRRSQLG